MIIFTYLYLSNLGSHRGSDRMVAMIYNYLCDQRLSPLKLRVRILLGERCTKYNMMSLSLPVTCGNGEAVVSHTFLSSRHLNVLNGLDF